MWSRELYKCKDDDYQYLTETCTFFPDYQFFEGDGCNRVVSHKITYLILR
jgi:hypothetical protein